MKYFIKKSVTLIITLFMISVATFFIFQIIPGDAVASIIGTEGTPEREAQLREQLGVDKPIPERYLKWIGGVLTGDLGRSYRYAENMNEMMSVSKLIGDKLPVTLWFALIALILLVLIAFPIGVLWAGSKSKKLDALLSICTQGAMSIPSFFLGIIMIFIFGLMLKLFTPGKYVSYSENLAGFLQYMIFPSLAIALPKAAMAARFLRNSLLEEAGADYVRTAYSKGCGKRRVIWGHMLKNALIPVITFMGSAIAELVAGSIVLEQVFGIPGIGRLLISSISTRDFPVVQILILYIAAVVMVVYFMVDLLYYKIDPRVEK